jgi:glycine/D-amino acid oxidase-like deaminating enzyme
MAVRHSNYWHLSSVPRTPLSIGVPKRADVAIIGGGLAGLAMLYEFIGNSQLSVYLLDEADIGYHASGRDIGLLSNVPDDYIRSVCRREKMSCDLTERGAIRVSNTVPGDTINVANLMPIAEYKYASYIDDYYGFNPCKFMAQLTTACESLGRHIVSNAIVERVAEGNKIYIKNRGTLVADNIIYCTGAYTPSLVKSMKSRIKVEKVHLMTTSPLETKYLREFATRVILHDKDIIRILNDRIMLRGSPTKFAAPNDGGIDQVLCEKLVVLLSSVFPTLPKSTVLGSVWSLVMASGKDGLPLVGTVPDANKQFMSVGVDTSFVFKAANTIMNMVVNGQSEDPALSPSRDMSCS